MVFIVEIGKDKLNWQEYNYLRFQQFLRDNEGKKIRIDLVKYKRSIQQNKMYWKWLEIVSAETGNDIETLHSHFKQFLPRRFGKVLLKKQIKEVELDKSTTLLTKNEFSDFLERCCAECGVPLLDTQTWHEQIDEAPMLNEL